MHAEVGQLGEHRQGRRRPQRPVDVGVDQLDDLLRVGGAAGDGRTDLFEALFTMIEIGLRGDACRGQLGSVSGQDRHVAERPQPPQRGEVVGEDPIGVGDHRGAPSQDRVAGQHGAVIGEVQRDGIGGVPGGVHDLQGEPGRSEALPVGRQAVDAVGGVLRVERDDVGERWSRKIKALKIEEWLERQQASIIDELRGRLVEFSREMSVEAKLIGEFDAANPSQFDPWDMKRTLRWLSAAGGALYGVAVIAGYFGATNFWNPVGWVASAVGVIAFGLSWLFDDREKKLQRQKAKAASQLRETIDKLESEVANSLKKWFYDSVTSRLVRAIRKDTKQLYTGMREVSRALEDGARQAGSVVEGLNKRLLVRTSQFVGVPIDEARVGRVVRDPGVRTKLLWRDGSDNERFCKQVGVALGEWVDGIPDGAAAENVARSLRPASVSPANVSISAQTAVVRIPHQDVGRAIGRRGSNVSLASRLLGIRIKVLGDESQANG